MFLKRPEKDKNYFTSGWEKNSRMLSKLHDTKDLTSPERYAISEYTYKGSKTINDPYFKGKFDSSPNIKKYQEEHGNNLHSSIKKAKKLPEELSTFSGLKSRTKKDFQIGDVIHTKGFTSTSLNPTIAKSFSSLKNDKKLNSSTQHILHFKLPKGYNKGRYLGKSSIADSEEEYLLAPNQKWKVTGHHIAKITKYHKKMDKMLPHHIHYWEVEPHEE